MKHLIIIFIAVFTVSARAQTFIPVESFMGIKFGTSAEKTIEHIKSIGGVHDIKSSKKNYYVFTNLKYNNRVPDFVYFRYSDNQMFEAGAYFKAQNKVQTLPLFVALKHDVSLTYGEGEDVRKFSGDFANGDGNELLAIETGYATYGTTWIEDKNNTKFNTVELMINPDLYVQLTLTEAKFSKARKK